MGRFLPPTTLLVLAAFVVAGAVVWLAYGQTSMIHGEPPLIQASATPLKKSPDDPGGRQVADLGGIGALMREQPENTPEEHLMPAAEQPLSPAEASAPSLDQGASRERASAPEKRSKPSAKLNGSSAKLDVLINELTSDDPVQPSGAGGPVTAIKVKDTQQDGVLALRPNEPERRRNPELSSREVRVARTGDGVTPDSGPRFQGTPGGRFRVQLAAVREEDDARRAWSTFQERLAAYVSDIEPFFEKAKTKNGVFYRVQIGPFADSGEATSLCLELKKQNASCFVVTR